MNEAIPHLASAKVPVSVVIPTLNESANLLRCLDHLKWADEVVIVDSGSRDATPALAEAWGAKVINFVWDGKWPKKRNWILASAELKHDWILFVDADELIIPELAEEIAEAVKSSEVIGYFINRRFMFMGRWLKHCGYYPSWNLRLLKRGFGEYEKLTDVGDTGSGDHEVHEQIVTRGPVAYLNHDMLHYAFPDVATFVEKHNRYSNWEAAVQFAGTPHSDSRISADGALARRRRIRNFSRSLPFRPSLRFLYSYVIKMGFLDGRAGLIFCRLLKMYEFLSVTKYKELKYASQNVPRPPQKPVKITVAPSILDRNVAAWTFSEKLMRILWAVVYYTVFRLTFHNWYYPRALILKLFGARIGRNVRIRRTVRIEIPWQLSLADDVIVGDEAILYALGPIRVGARSAVSQYSHLCAGTHDHSRPDYPLIRAPITIGEDCWIAADVFVGPGVSIGDRTVVGARASVFKDLPPDVIAVGNPARPIRSRDFNLTGPHTTNAMATD